VTDQIHVIADEGHNGVGLGQK